GHLDDHPGVRLVREMRHPASSSEIGRGILSRSPAPWRAALHRPVHITGRRRNPSLGIPRPSSVRGFSRAQSFDLFSTHCRTQILCLAYAKPATAKEWRPADGLDLELAKVAMGLSCRLCAPTAAAAPFRRWNTG